MATYFPQSEASFLAIHGVGRRKLAAYGEPFLAAIRAYSAEHGLAGQTKTAAPAADTREPIVPKSRTEEVGRLFAAGHPRGRDRGDVRCERGTVVQHLGRCVWAGQRFTPERVHESRR